MSLANALRPEIPTPRARKDFCPYGLFLYLGASRPVRGIGPMSVELTRFLSVGRPVSSAWLHASIPERPFMTVYTGAALVAGRLIYTTLD